METPITDCESLVERTFGCEHCHQERPDLKGIAFVPVNGGTDRHYKFPPIGALSHAKVLFIAESPRYGGENNIRLHEHVMKDLQRFHRLAANIDHDNKPYISEGDNREGFYKYHLQIAAAVDPSPFEEVAAATEMFLCATRGKGPSKRHLEISPCAQQFLWPLIVLSRPRFVVTFGSPIREFFRNYVAAWFGEDWSQPEPYSTDVFHLPFWRRNRNDALMDRCVEWVCRSVKNSTATVEIDADLIWQVSRTRYSTQAESEVIAPTAAQLENWLRQ